MNDIDLAALADQFLDDELDPAAWEQARATHGPALDAALTRMRTVRSELRGFSRPELPTDLRQRLLAEIPHAKVAPAPLAFPRSARWWRIALPTALAAMLLVVVILARQPTHSSTIAPAVARQESKADSESESIQRKELRGADKKQEMLEKAAIGSVETAKDGLKDSAAAPGMDLVADKEHSKNIAEVMVGSHQSAKEPDTASDRALDGGSAGDTAPANIAEAQQRASVAAPAAAKPAASAAMAAKAGAPLAAPVIIAARWHTPTDTRERDGAPAENKVNTDERRSDAGGSTEPAQPLAPGHAAMAEAAPQVDGQRLLRITLRNSGSEPLHLLSGSVQLIGIASSGRTLWKTPVQRDLTIAAGESVTWDESVPVIPPGVAHLRIEAQGAKSADILP